MACGKENSRWGTVRSAGGGKEELLGKSVDAGVGGRLSVGGGAGAQRSSTPTENLASPLKKKYDEGR